MVSESLPTNHRSTTKYQLFSDYHTHPQGHRVQRYTRTLLQPWADSARNLGLTDIAFTDHDRYHAGIDFDEIDRLRERNPDLRIRAGIELDNDPIHSAAGRNWIEKHWDKLDFVLIKIHGHRPGAEIGSLVNETLDFIHAQKLAIELSTAGWRKPVNELYPGDRIIELAIEKGISFTTASDAHSYAQLGDNFPSLARKMATFGIRQVCIFEKHIRTQLQL